MRARRAMAVAALRAAGLRTGAVMAALGLPRHMVLLRPCAPPTPAPAARAPRPAPPLPPPPPPPVLVKPAGRKNRPDGGGQRRFVAPKPTASRERAGLPKGHPALVNATTLFRTTVVDAEASPRLLVSGRNNPKLGRVITRGSWAGMPIYHLTLEERATCPTSCSLWSECYGNGMHMARRHRPGPALERRLREELAHLAEWHPGGFVVRLHTLGDFYSPRYAARWSAWLARIPALHLFGFTAHPDASPTAQLVERMNGRHPDRCAIRFTRARPTGLGWEATTIWRQPERGRVAEGVVCPAQRADDRCCATCGLCWAPKAGRLPIVFIGHGAIRKGNPA